MLRAFRTLEVAGMARAQHRSPWSCHGVAISVNVCDAVRIQGSSPFHGTARLLTTKQAYTHLPIVSWVSLGCRFAFTRHSFHGGIPPRACHRPVEKKLPRRTRASFIASQSCYRPSSLSLRILLSLDLSGSFLLPLDPSGSFLSRSLRIFLDRCGPRGRSGSSHTPSVQLHLDLLQGETPRTGGGAPAPRKGAAHSCSFVDGRRAS